MTIFFPLFLLDNNNREKENKNSIRVQEIELSQKLFKGVCSNIIYHFFWGHVGRESKEKIFLSIFLPKENFLSVNYTI